MGRKLYAKGEGFNPTTGIDDVEGLREELDALKGGSGGGGGDTTAIERRLTTAEGEIDALQGDVAEQSEEIAAVGAKVNTLQGSDTGKSVRTIAAEETAKIVGGAPDNYDTLKEIADYISSDAEGAAELRNKVNKNATDIADLQELTEAIVKVNAQQDTALGTKASKTEAQGYATTAKNEAIAAAAADAQEKANTAESNANDYTDGAVEDLAKGQVATNKANIASLSATVKTNTNNIATHTQQIANLDSNKLGKTEKAADSAKADYATSAGSATKLATARKIWGQNFDGTGGVIDDLILFSLAGNSDGNAPSARVVFAGSNSFYGPYMQAVASGGYGLKKLIIYQNKTASWATDYSNHYEAVVIDIFGNVGIGTTTPTEKLEVSGNVKASKFIGALQGNADSATKLATPRTIWGQSFDGIKDVDGDMTLGGRIYASGDFFIMHSETGRQLSCTTTFTILGAANLTNGLPTYIDGHNVYIRYANDTAISSFLSNGNVAIGGTSASERLHIYGGGIFTGDVTATNFKGNLSGTIDRVANTGDNATPIHLLGLPTEDNNKPLIDTGVTVEEGIISAEGFKTSGAVEAATLEGNLVGTIKAVMRNTNLFLLGFAQEAGAAAKPYVTTQVSVNNGVLTIKGLRVEGDVEITGNTVIGGRLTSAASYQSSPISTTSEEGVPSTEEQLRAQISTLEERIAALEQLIAQNNG